MDIYTMQEEAYKRGEEHGFEAGYLRGCSDNLADAMKGAIEWHEGAPDEDKEVCYIVHKSEIKKRFIVRPAVYRKKHGFYFAEEFTEDGSYYEVRIPQADVPLWAEVKIPFCFRAEMEVPGDGDET